MLDVDAPAEAQRSGDGLEAAARHVRYRALADLALQRGAPIVVAAHTRDDQAETVLLHILRGTGLDGLSGMPGIRSLADGVELVRPMLQLTRADSEAVCRAIGWEPVHDPSNDSSRHTRNRVRRELLPLMREFNPNATERLVQLAALASDDRALLDRMTQDALESSRKRRSPPTGAPSSRSPTPCAPASSDSSAANAASSSQPSGRRRRWR